MHLLLAAAAQAVNVVKMPDDPLAHQALKVAQDTLTVTQHAYTAAMVAAVIALAAFIATYIDVRNNARQFKDFMRRPQLGVSAKPEHPKLAIQTSNDGGKTLYYTYHDRTNFLVSNTGTRAAVGYQLEVWFPITSQDPNVANYTDTKDFDGMSFGRYVVVSPKKVYPNGYPDTVPLNAPFINATPHVHYYWRITDDYQQYPPEGFGEGTYTFWESSGSSQLI